MEPNVADEYDRLMDALQEAAEEDPQGERVELLRRQVEAFLREHLSNGAVLSTSNRTVH